MYSVSDEYKNLILADSTQHVLKIYIDDVEIESKYILGLSISHVLFENDEFCFGSTPARTAELKIHKDALPDTYERVYIETGISNSSLVELIPVGYFNVDEIEKEDDYTVKLTLIDDMSKFEFNYDGSVLTYPKTMLEVLQNICDTAGIELGSTDFLNSDKTVAVYDNTVTARTYIGYIAEQAGGFAVIGRDGKLYIRTIGEDTDELELRKFSEYSWGEEFKISRIAYEDGVQDFKAGDTTNNTVWIDSNNMYIVSQEQIDNIYNNYLDFDCYSFSGTSIVDPAWDIGDILTIDDKKIIYQGSIEYKGKFKASIESDIQCKAKEETTATKVSDSTILRRVQASINQIEGEIQLLTEETGEYSETLTQLQLDVDGLTATVESLTDYTGAKTQVHNLYIDESASGEGYITDFIVYGGDNFTSTDITLCVSEYQKGYGYTNYLSTEDGNIIITEDGDLLITGESTYYTAVLKLTLDDILRSLTIDEETTIYDTLEILQDGTVQITRRIGVDEEGNLYQLDEEVVTVLEETAILPTYENGTYYYIKEFDSITYYAEYIKSSDYSDLFATKVELNSSITQLSNEVNISLDAKVNDEDLTGANILLRINGDESEATINADKINLNGYISNDEGSFSIDENGNASFSNGSVTINQNGIEMADGTSIVGGNGIYTNLVFTSEWEHLGLYMGYDYDTAVLKYLTIYAQIPENFVVKNAYITVYHQPITWCYYNSMTATSYSYTQGHAQNVQVYVNTIYGNEYVYVDSETSDTETTMSGTETTALGEEGTTFGSSSVESVVSTDLSNYLSAGKLTKFTIGTTIDATTITSMDDTYARTGRAIAQLQVLGYLSVD